MPACLASNKFRQIIADGCMNFPFYPPARKTRSLQERDIRAQKIFKLNNDILKYISLSTRNCLEKQCDLLTVGQMEIACRANRISGRQQEPAGTREEVLPLALQKLMESISLTEWRMSRLKNPHQDH